MKKIYFLVPCLCFLIFGIINVSSIKAVTDTGENTPVIGLLNSDTCNAANCSKKMSFFNSDSDKVGSYVFSTGFPYYVNASPYLPYYVRTIDFTTIDIHSDEGVEWLSYGGYDGDGKITIQNQGGTILDTFTVFSNKINQAKIATGELSSDYEEEEIVVCKQNNSVPRIKIYSYSEENGATKIKSFKPFGENQKNKRGCAGLTVGDVDGDGENEIIAVNSKNNRVKIFNINGTKESQFDLEQNFDEDYSLYSVDLDGDGNKNLIFKGEDDILYVISNEGEEIFTMNWNNVLESNKKINNYVVGDVDGDNKDEIIIRRKGRKVKIYVIDENGEAESEFFAFSNAKSKKKRYLFVAPFSY